MFAANIKAPPPPPQLRSQIMSLEKVKYVNFRNIKYGTVLRISKKIFFMTHMNYKCLCWCFCANDALLFLGQMWLLFYSLQWFVEMLQCFQRFRQNFMKSPCILTMYFVGMLRERLSNVSYLTAFCKEKFLITSLKSTFSLCHKYNARFSESHNNLLSLYYRHTETPQLGIE